MSASHMKWSGSVVRAMVALAAFLVLQAMFRSFPAMSILTMVLLALLIGIIGYLADAMFDGHLSPSGRPLVAFIVAFGVMGTYLSRFSSPLRFLHTYATYALWVAVAVAVGDWVYSMTAARKKVS